jgi:hypothetical protein
MAQIKPRITEEMQRWIEARKRFHLSHAQVQMARELGMNPRKLGKLANHKQEPWKAPLPVFIEQIFQKRFGKSQPDRVVSIEDRAREIAAKKAEKQQRRQDTNSRGENEPDKSGRGKRIEDGGSQGDRRRGGSILDLPSSILDPNFAILDPPSSILHPQSSARLARRSALRWLSYLPLLLVAHLPAQELAYF